MPTYDYLCTTCGITFERTQKMSEEAIIECPTDVCQQQPSGKGLVERVISGGGGVIYKGGGFYHTDYVKKTEKGGEES